MTKTIYVGNIPWSADEEKLKEFFSEYAQVVDARIITERATGRSKGYGFVEIADDEDADLVVEQVNGKEMEGRKLVVNEAKPRLEQGN